MSEFKTLTPTEMAKLPNCKWMRFGTCKVNEKEKTQKECLDCMLGGMHQSLVHKDVASAHCILDALYDLLKEAKML